MHFSTSIFALQALGAFLLFSSPFYAAATICHQGVCAGDTVPKHGRAALSSRHPSTRHRWDLEPHTRTEGALRTEDKLQRRYELYAQALSPPRLSARGNGICHYPLGQAPLILESNQKSPSFVLPAGKWALKWRLCDPRSNSDIFFEIWAINEAGTHPDTQVNLVISYGETFLSDGVTRIYLAMFNFESPGPRQSAEIWMQAV